MKVKAILICEMIKSIIIFIWGEDRVSGWVVNSNIVLFFGMRSRNHFPIDLTSPFGPCPILQWFLIVLFWCQYIYIYICNYFVIWGQFIFVVTLIESYNSIGSNMVDMFLHKCPVQIVGIFISHLQIKSLFISTG